MRGEDEYGTDLHSPGQLHDSRPDTAEGSNAPRQIWDVAQNIPEKPQERDVRQHDAVREAEQPPVGDRPYSAEMYRENHDEALGEQTRTRQNKQPDGLGGVHE